MCITWPTYATSAAPACTPASTHRPMTLGSTCQEPWPRCVCALTRPMPGRHRWRSCTSATDWSSRWPCAQPSVAFCWPAWPCTAACGSPWKRAISMRCFRTRCSWVFSGPCLSPRCWPWPWACATIGQPFAPATRSVRPSLRCLPTACVPWTTQRACATLMAATAKAAHPATTSPAPGEKYGTKLACTALRCA